MYKLEQKIKDTFSSKVTPSYYENGKLDLLELCKDLKIEVYNFDFSDDKSSGAIIYKNGQWTIYVNSTDSSRRKRFTVAHELGHYFSYISDSHSKKEIDEKQGFLDFAILRRPADAVRGNGGSTNEVTELEANAIAGEILMPEEEVRRLVESDKNVEELADYFEVSESAMTVRLINLGIQIFENSFVKCPDPVTV